MSRLTNLSSNALQAMFSPETTDDLIVLLRIEQDSSEVLWESRKLPVLNQENTLNNFPPGFDLDRPATPFLQVWEYAPEDTVEFSFCETKTLSYGGIGYQIIKKDRLNLSYTAVENPSVPWIDLTSSVIEFYRYNGTTWLDMHTTILTYGSPYLVASANNRYTVSNSYPGNTGDVVLIPKHTDNIYHRYVAFYRNGSVWQQMSTSEFQFLEATTLPTGSISGEFAMNISANTSTIDPLTIIYKTKSFIGSAINLANSFTRRLGAYTTDREVIYGVRSNDTDYIYLPFEITLPSEDVSSSPTCSVIFHDVTRELMPVIRNLQSPPKVYIDLVLASSPDIIEATFPGFYLTNISYSAETLKADLSMVNYALEPFPAFSFTPNYFPGLF